MSDLVYDATRTVLQRGPELGPQPHRSREGADLHPTRRQSSRPSLCPSRPHAARRPPVLSRSSSAPSWSGPARHSPDGCVAHPHRERQQGRSARNREPGGRTVVVSAATASSTSSVATARATRTGRLSPTRCTRTPPTPAPHEEGHERDDRRNGRQPAAPGQTEAEQDNIPRHAVVMTGRSAR